MPYVYQSTCFCFLLVLENRSGSLLGGPWVLLTSRFACETLQRYIMKLFWLFSESDREERVLERLAHGGGPKDRANLYKAQFRIGNTKEVAVAALLGDEMARSFLAERGIELPLPPTGEKDRYRSHSPPHEHPNRHEEESEAWLESVKEHVPHLGPHIVTIIGSNQAAYLKNRELSADNEAIVDEMLAYVRTGQGPLEEKYWIDLANKFRNRHEEELGSSHSFHYCFVCEPLGSLAWLVEFKENNDELNPIIALNGLIMDNVGWDAMIQSLRDLFKV